MRRAPHIHPITCGCTACNSPAGHHRRKKLALKGATRIVLLVAALCAIPFAIAWAVTNAGDRR